MHILAGSLRDSMPLREFCVPQFEEIRLLRQKTALQPAKTKMVASYTQSVDMLAKTVFQRSAHKKTSLL